MKFVSFIKLLVIAAFGVFLTNCGSNAQQSNDGSLVAMKMSQQDDSILETQALEGDSNIGSDDNDDPQPVSDDDDNSNEAEGDDEATEEGPRNHICVLAGPGKSVRLGYIDDMIQEHGSTPNVVCMSEKACIEQVSRVFEIKGPERRGFCPSKNPHVHSLSHDDLKTIIDGMESEE